MIYQLRMLSDENDNFVRGYEIESTSTLEDLRQFICRDLSFDEGVMSSFFTADKQWTPLREFTSMDMGIDEQDAPLPMTEVALSQVMASKFDRLIFLFDQIGERGLFLELVEAKAPDAGMEYPRVSLSEGGAPDQFEPGNGEGSIFDAVMEEFGLFEGDDSYDDE